MVDQRSFFSDFYAGDFEKAAKKIEEKANQSGKNQILLSLDTGLSYFEARNYKKAIFYLTQAEELTSLKDYTSITEETIALISTDNYKEYIPLDYERIMINVYLALSYFMLEKYESALVECRRINQLIYDLKNKGMKSFEELTIAWYLSALIYETQGKYNDALIAYKRVEKLTPSYPNINEDIKRAKDKLYGSYSCAKCGEIIFIASSGFIPIKRSVNYQDNYYPIFVTRTEKMSLVKFNDKHINKILDLEDIARKNLEERKGKLIGKDILRLVTQAGLSYGVAKATKSNELGFLTFLLLRSATSPDLRSWNTLPRYIYIGKIILPYGKHSIKINTPYEENILVDINEGNSSELIIRRII
jgi:hypothetical protein